MEFNEKLQQLRTGKNLTQEQLAEQLYVSRTAISKWESGKGYPNIESLKCISKFFSVTIDELLSGEELITLAETENRSNLKKIYSFIYGILDMMAVTFILLPLYGNLVDGYIYSVNLLSFTDTTPIYLAIYWIVFIVLIALGIAKLMCVCFEKESWSNIITKCSLVLSTLFICFFAAARQLYIMLLVDIMIYVAIAAYLFSREYTESTLKTILPIPISRTKLLIGKFCTLLLWIVMLTLVTWAGIFIGCGLYDAVFTLEGYSLLVAIVWLPKFLFGSILMFLTVSPFVFVAMKTKGFVAPMIGSAVIVMGSAALSNQEWGALYPWTATYFLVQGKLQSTGYPTLLSVSIIILVSAVGFLMTFHHFKKEDLK